MNNTVNIAASQSDVASGSELQWINREARPLLAKLREISNNDYRGTFELSTSGTGAAATIWTSDSLPTNSVWLVEARVVGFKTSGASQQAAYICTATFYNNAGAVAQLGATTATYTNESAAGCDCTLSVSGQTVICQVTDDGANTFDWLASITVTRSREE